VFAGVEAGAAVLADPPEGQCAEDGDWRIDGSAGGEGLEDIRPNYWVPVQQWRYRPGAADRRFVQRQF